MNCRCLVSARVAQRRESFKYVRHVSAAEAAASVFSATATGLWLTNGPLSDPLLDQVSLNTFPLEILEPCFTSGRHFLRGPSLAD